MPRSFALIVWPPEGGSEAISPTSRRIEHRIVKFDGARWSVAARMTT